MKYLLDYYHGFNHEITKFQWPDPFENSDSAKDILQEFLNTMERDETLLFSILSKNDEFLGKEAIILYDQTGNPVSIYTFDASLKRRLEKFAKQYPECCRLESASGLGAVTYIIDKTRLSIRLVPPEERRQAASEYAKRNSYGSGGASTA